MSGLIEACKCAKCGTFVRRWETWRDDATGDSVFRVYCHGEVDECRVDWRDVHPGMVVDVVAFRNTLSLPNGDC
jgi:hypothetical protein